MENAAKLYRVRWAEEKDWGPAMRMVWRTFLKFEGKEYSEEGVRNFFDFISDADIHDSFLRGTYQMMVATLGGEIVGTATVRNGHHLSLLFVDERHQHRGVGSLLMDRMCRYLAGEAGESFMSLTAAPRAVEFYRKLGFRVVAPERESGGIRVVAMEKHF